MQDIRTPNDTSTKRNVDMYRRKMRYYLNLFKEEDSDHNDDDDDRNVQFKKANVGYFDENDKENISGISYIKDAPNMITNFKKVTNAPTTATGAIVGSIQGSQDPCPKYNPIPVTGSGAGGPISTHLNGDQQHLEPIFENNCNDKNKENIPKRSHSLQKSVKDIKDVKFLINGKKYELVQKLGFGGSSTVFECIDLDEKRKVAVKAIKFGRNGVFLDEVHLLKKLQESEHIIKMFDYDQFDNHLYVVLEKGDCDLSRIIKNSSTKTPLPIPSIVFYWYHMLKAVQFIHSKGIIHSDLKPSNFLLVEGVLKLIDFGIASVLPNDMTSVIKNELIGTFSYISPEAIFDSRNSIDEFSPNAKPKYKVNFKSDVWSLGCILYQMIYKKSPFQHIGNIHAKILMIMDQNHKITFNPVGKPYEKFIQTIRKCLIHDYRKRISIDELLEHLERLFIC